jgi:hypothetical protein
MIEVGETHQKRVELAAGKNRPVDRIAPRPLRSSKRFRMINITMIALLAANGITPSKTIAS